MDKLKAVIKSSPFIIAFIYVMVGALWIQYSDQLVFSLFEDTTSLTQAQSLKGWFYVLVSGVLIFFLVYQSNNIIDKLIEDLKRSRDKFESTFEHAPIGIAHHKPNENWILVNRALCKQLGYTRSELLSLNFQDFIHTDDLERGRNLDRDIINGEISSYKTEKKYRRKDGSYFTGKVTKSAVYDQNKTALYLIAIVEDISQQKEAEQKMKESLEEKQILLSEVHHRVKNNIALMSALLELQLMHGKTEDTKQILEHYKTRLKTLSLIYENFSGVEREPTIKFSWYLHEQINFLNQLFENDRKEIDFQTDIDEVEMNINQAIPVGLICNELLIVTNQHEFGKADKPIIHITLKQNGDSMEFTVQNNGTLKNDLFDLSNPDSLDSRIIAALSKQIKGEVSHHQQGNMQTFTLRFKKGTWRGAASYFQPDA